MRPSLTLLCGGASRRMGRDKALLLFRGETLLARQLRLAQDFAVQVAGGGRPLPEGVRSVADLAPAAGPLSALAGALAALTEASGTWILPVDTLITPRELVAALGTPQETTMAWLLGQPQPLLGYYDKALLPHILQLWATGERRMQALIPRAKRVDVPDAWAARANFNTPEQWRHACDAMEFL